jgi:hypothetical protein
VTTLLAFLLLTFGARVRSADPAPLDEAVRDLWRVTATVTVLILVTEALALLGVDA